MPFLTNETLFTLGVIPTHLMILGGGPIGLEMAQAFCRLGSQVTVVERETRLLLRDDPELAAIVEARLAAEGVRLIKGAAVATASLQQGAPTLTLADGTQVAGSHLLVAAGRTPALESLDLQAAGVEYGPRGISTDAAMRTSNRRIYAIGDAVGGLQFTHAANYHAGLVIRHALFRLPVRMNPDRVPWVTYTDPELAQLGLTEAEAARRGLALQVARWPFARNDRARAMRDTGGLIKIVTDKKGRVLGVGIAGPGAGEMIAAYSLAMDRGLELSHLARPVIAYPTLAEAGKRASLSQLAALAQKPAVRWLTGLLMRLP